MSAAPLLLRAELVRISAHPRLGFHEAAAVGAALGVLNEEGAGLAGIVTLFANLGGNFTITNSLASSLKQPLRHLSRGSTNLGDMLDCTCILLRLRHQFFVA